MRIINLAGKIRHKDFSTKNKNVLPPLSFFLWSYCVPDDWLSSRAAVSLAPWWSCTPEQIQIQFCRTRSVSCLVFYAMVCRAIEWICGNDLWCVCVRCLRRLFSQRNRQGNQTSYDTKRKQYILREHIF